MVDKRVVKTEGFCSEGSGEFSVGDVVAEKVALYLLQRL